jgi:hypothetical protein
MGFDSYIAWDVYCGYNVMSVCDDCKFLAKEGLVFIRDLIEEVRRLQKVVSLTNLPRHPTAMTPDELLDFAMRFVQDK